MLEDVLRLGPAGRPELVRRARALRHAVGGFTAGWNLSAPERLSARNAQADPGRSAATASDGDPVERNCARAAEACRVLEEAARELGLSPQPPAAARFACYDLERLAALPAGRRGVLETARLYVLLDPAATDRALPALAARVIEAGARLLQVRLKEGTDEARLAILHPIVACAGEAGALVIVNDRADLAVAAGADGVHVGEHDLPPAEARRIIGPDRLLGVTAHSPEEARIGWAAGADYLGYGTVFDSLVKPERRACGPHEVRAVAADAPIPVYAIGGITPANCAGLERIAVGSAIGRAHDPAAATAELLAALQ